jgi:UDP-N-acetylmuramate--alanine ligase
VPTDVGLVIHSAAYTTDNNVELSRATDLGLPILKYTDALGAYSAAFDSSAIAGVHGKTTTTAMTGVMFRAAGLPAQVLAGSAVTDFGGTDGAEGARSTLYLGDKYFAAETCEYRRHFLAFHPRRIVLTSVESDHQDCFPTYDDIFDAFAEYTSKLPDGPDGGGELIYCADDPGASGIAAYIAQTKPAVKRTPYGFTAGGPFKRTAYTPERGTAAFTLAGSDGPFTLRIPGRHNALNAAAAFALTVSLGMKEFGRFDDDKTAAVKAALEAFRGCKRRSELVGEAAGITIMDDYAHHPTAIRTTLAGLAAFYPGRRLVVSFMSHTYTRTAALLPAFAAAFDAAAVVILHKIYASAREQAGAVTGITLFDRMSACRPGVYYIDDPLDAVPLAQTLLRPGDVFVTMGAGDNWKLGKAVLASGPAAPAGTGVPPVAVEPGVGM